MDFDVPENALQDQTSIVITRSIAEKYFGSEKPVNQVMTINGQSDYRDWIFVKSRSGQSDQGLKVRIRT
jgi:hypothetical protein